MTAPTSDLTLSAADLMRMSFPEPRWAVPGIQPAGLTLLVGRPKRGKSWYALQVAVAVASGGKALGSIGVEQGEVLYLALEDTYPRLQARLSSLLQGSSPPPALDFRVQIPRDGEGGLERIKAWLTAHPDARLVIVDTLARFRPPQGRGGVYEEDYRALAGLKRLADSHGVSILVIHHTRKAAAVDPLDEVSGSQGLAGAADCVQVLKRERDRAEADLFITGRDVEERTIPIRWDPELTVWTLIGKQLSPERAAVVDLLEQAGRGLTIAEVARQLKRDPGPTRQLLWRMWQAGLISKTASTYLPRNSRNGSNSGNAGTAGTGETGR